ncbi:MAG: response regulator [Chloroflexi bacterium]|nr:MAG: response regulator [Chloroflexota bacterium]TMG41715.1 MAG: response regulator [Chloroflexota bacterium]
MSEPSRTGRTERPRVLVIDDDDELCNVLRDALADEYAVATVPHGAAALALTKHHHPAVILLDLRMPIMDGWSFLEQYRRHPNGVSKIVLLSGHPDLAAQAERVGADGYVQKPFDLERIRETIARALDGTARS